MGGKPQQHNHHHHQQQQPQKKKKKHHMGGGGKSKEEKLSRALSWALRHQGPSIGLSMTPDGYVPVDQILQSQHPKLQGDWTLQDIQDMVQASDKQRFQLAQRPASNYAKEIVQQQQQHAKKKASKSNATNANSTIWCIRATQGHSLKFVDSDLLLTPLSPEELAALPVIVHGTYRDKWTAIQTTGLKKMNRNHIHFASGLPNDDGEVISGMRKTCNVLIYVDAAKCAASGDEIVFYKSANGVLLTAGINGTLPAKYFSHVTDREGNLLLDQRPEPVAK